MSTVLEGYRSGDDSVRFCELELFIMRRLVLS